MRSIEGIRQVVHRARLVSVSADRCELTLDPPPPWAADENEGRGKYVTFERKDGSKGEVRVVVASDGDRVRLDISIATEFDQLSRELTFWEPEPFDCVLKRMQPVSLAEPAATPGRMFINTAKLTNEQRIKISAWHRLEESDRTSAKLALSRAEDATGDGAYAVARDLLEAFE